MACARQKAAAEPGRVTAMHQAISDAGEGYSTGPIRVLGRAGPNHRPTEPTGFASMASGTEQIGAAVRRSATDVKGGDVATYSRQRQQYASTSEAVRQESDRCRRPWRIPAWRHRQIVSECYLARNRHCAVVSWMPVNA